MDPIVLKAPEYAGRRALVLGAAGFIGTWVARALALSGASVTGVVRAGSRVGAPLRGRAAPQRIVEADLRDGAALDDIVAAARPSIVFNLAGYGVDHTERDDDEAYRLNVELVDRLGRSLARGRDSDWEGADIVHVGSGAEYGAVVGGAIDEYSPPQPVSAYGRTKLEGTLRLRALSEELGLRSIVARPFTVYGPGEHDGRLLPTLLSAAATGDPVHLTGGEQRRDFVFVGDVVEALLRLGSARNVSPGYVVNVATGRLGTVREFTEVAASALGIRRECLRFGTIPTRTDEFAYTSVSNERLERLVGWVPASPVDEGVRRTAAWIGALAHDPENDPRRGSEANQTDSASGERR